MVGKFRKDLSPYTRQGVPDILLIYNGRLIGLEVKSETGIQTQAQIDFQKDMESAGAKYFVVRSIEDVEEVLRRL